MMVSAHRGHQETRPPTDAELRKVWNLLIEYEREPNQKIDSLYAALRGVRGMAPAKEISQ